MPSQKRKSLEAVSEKIIPVLLDEIGSGASGSVVQKCLLGSVTAAAKVTFLLGNICKLSLVFRMFQSSLQILLGTFG